METFKKKDEEHHDTLRLFTHCRQPNLNSIFRKYLYKTQKYQI